jgi:acyl-coenzyme A thioesterase PaaI-like protein
MSATPIQNSTKLSTYFQKGFVDYIKNISFIEIDKSTGVVEYELILDDKCTNPMNKVHGGVTATLVENLSTLGLFHFTKAKYKTLEIGTIYKKQVEIETVLNIKIYLKKINNSTCFIEVELAQNGDTCVQASIVKTKIEAKF